MGRWRPRPSPRPTSTSPRTASHAAIAGLPPIDGTTTAKITADNTSPQVGDTVTVTYTVVTPAASNPTDLALPADIMTPTGKVTLGGAQTGSVTVTGPRQNPRYPAGEPSRRSP